MSISTGSATLTMRERRRWATGRGGYAYEKTEGPNYYRDAGELRQGLRIIDREGNRYRERIARSDGTVVRDVDEPLDQHTGYGSAKGRSE